MKELVKPLELRSIILVNSAFLKIKRASFRGLFFCLSTMMIELKLLKNFPQEIIAVDEVGRGPLCGPVVVAAMRVFCQDELKLKKLLSSLKDKQIGDSKKISPQKRKLILDGLGIKDQKFRQTGVVHSLPLDISFVTWEMDHEVIDRENILWASLRGMREASIHLSEKKQIATTVFIDGHMKFKWETTPCSWNEIPIVKGDSKSLLIGLASLIAKEKRDQFMRQMHEIYPQYGINTHFGYPTKAHKKAIEQFGPSPIHRKTFKGVREFISS